MNFHRRNLNLLVALDALIMEKSITRAAERLHLSQPAMSSVVSKLREWLDDPLLVRGGAGYVLTPRAQELAGPLREVLADIEDLVSSRAFDPSTSQRTFRIAMADASVLLPRLLHVLQTEAPNMEVKVTSFDSFPEQALAYGELDLVVGNVGNVPAGFMAEKLFEGYPLCAVRRDHPRIRDSISIDQLVSERHVIAVAEDSMYLAFARNALAKHNVSVRITAQVSHFIEAAIIASQSELIASIPNRLARLCEESLGLRVLQMPIPFPNFQVQQIWHERTSLAPDHQWLRTTLKRIFTDF